MLAPIRTCGLVFGLLVRSPGRRIAGPDGFRGSGPNLWIELEALGKVRVLRIPGVSNGAIMLSLAGYVGRAVPAAVQAAGAAVIPRW